MIQLKNVTKEFGDKTVLDDVCLQIYDGEKVVIIGENGQGKSTLLDVILKRQPVDSGEVITDGTFGFLQQNAKIDEKKLFEQLKNKEFAGEFYYNLKLLGFEKDFALTDERLSKLSCGEQTKMVLAQVLAQNPSVLILDEPTNHLDINGKNEVVKILKDFYGTLIVVSHDVDFINQIAYKLIELKNGKVFEYYGNYDDFLSQKENEKLRIEREYEKHTQQIADIKKQIDIYQRALAKSDSKKHRGSSRTCNSTTQDERAASLSRFAANRISKLKQQLDKDVQRPEKEHKIKYKLAKDDVKTKFLFIAENLSKKHGNQVIFENANFTIKSGDKIGIVGDNGAGKTTLLNILLGKIDFEGKLFVAPSVKSCLMKQDIYDLDFDKTINELSQSKDKEFRTNFILNLCTMKIDKSRFNTKIEKLSSGEKMRIKLAEVILSDANVIFMDEPTNHLDIANKTHLEKVLEGFNGTLVLVSHDKDFLRKTTNVIFEIKDKKIIVKDNKI